MRGDRMAEDRPGAAASPLGFLGRAFAHRNYRKEGGLLASRVGAPAAMLAGAAGCVAGGLLFARQLPRLRELVRPIYARLGILPEVAGGMGAAAEVARAE
jgi:hypothetical protein